MLLGEELVLLLLDDDSGRWLAPRQAVRGSLRVALVVELLARRALALDDEGRFAAGLSGGTGGDALLDRVAAQVVGKRPEELGQPGRGELEEVLRRLRDGGVLRRAPLRRSRHLPRDHHPETGVRTRLLAALQHPARPELRTALLAALAHELGLIPLIFTLPAAEVTALQARAAALTQELREGRHLVGGQPDAGERESRSALDTVGDLADLLEVATALGGLARLAWIPLRALGRLLDPF